MSIKISELPQADTVNNTDEIPIVQQGTTKKAPAGLIHPPIATAINSTSTNSEIAGAKAVYDYANNLTSYKYTITSYNAIRYSGAWENMNNEYRTDTIQAGTYLVVVRFLVMGQNATGVLTAKILIDGSEEDPAWRCTIPLPSGTESVSGFIIETKTFTTTTTHTIRLQGYGTANWLINGSSPTYPVVEFIKISNATASRNSLNNTRLMNTDSLADKDVGEIEQVEQFEQVKEQAENISEENQEEKQEEKINEAEPIETKTEGSGDSK